MNKYEQRLSGMHAHIQRHPADWQTKIAILKTESKAIQYEMDQKYNKQMAQLAQIRRATYEECTQQ